MAHFDFIYSQLTVVTFDFYSIYREHAMQKKTIQRNFQD